MIHVHEERELTNTGYVVCDDCDPTGHTSTTTVHVRKRPTASTAGPYTVPEAGSVGLHGSANDPHGQAFAYAWDLDHDGIFETHGQDVTFSAATRDGPLVPDVQPVTFRACTSDGRCATTDTTVSIYNVAPAITSVTNNGPVAVGSPALINVVATDVAGPSRDPYALRVRL